MRILLRVVTWVASWASLISLILASRPLARLQWSLAGMLTVVMLLLMIWDAWIWWHRMPRRFRPGSQEIVDYLKNWIGSGGRVVIFTRDMSWATATGAGDVRKLLHQKAESEELTICLPERIGLATELEKSGATIIVYDQIKFVPKSRFTIIHYGKTGQRVAVGRTLGQNHEIEEFSEGIDPAFELANDLFGLLQAIRPSARSQERKA